MAFGEWKATLCVHGQNLPARMRYFFPLLAAGIGQPTSYGSPNTLVVDDQRSALRSGILPSEAPPISIFDSGQILKTDTNASPAGREGTPPKI